MNYGLICGLVLRRTTSPPPKLETYTALVTRHKVTQRCHLAVEYRRIRLNMTPGPLGLSSVSAIHVSCSRPAFSRTVLSCNLSRVMPTNLYTYACRVRRWDLEVSSHIKVLKLKLKLMKIKNNFYESKHSNMYTMVHKNRDILYSTITSADLNFYIFIIFIYHFSCEEIILHPAI